MSDVWPARSADPSQTELGLSDTARIFYPLTHQLRNSCAKLPLLNTRQKRKEPCLHWDVSDRENILRRNLIQMRETLKTVIYRAKIAYGPDFPASSKL